MPKPPSPPSDDGVATSTLSLALALLGAAAVVAAIWWTAREESGVRAAVVELALAAGIVLLQIGVVVGVGGGPFDAMSVLYLDLVVGLPLVALALLVGGRVGRRWGLPRLGRIASGVAIAVVVALPAIGFYATHVEPYRVTLDEVAAPLASVRSGRDPIRIGVLTDLQTTAIGDYERHAVDLLRAAHPDLVLVGGDLFQGTPRQFEANRRALRDLIVSLDAPGGVYVVQGDTDDGPTLDELFAGTPVTYLWNEVVETQVGDRTIRLAGLGLGEGREGRAALAELAAAPPGTVRLALSHQPDWVLEPHIPGAIDLLVAGHTHGGQIQLPWFGPLLTLTDVPRDVAAGGLHDVGRTPVYVSHGVGHEQQGAPQVRFLAPPSVGLVTLSTVGGEISP